MQPTIELYLLLYLKFPLKQKAQLITRTRGACGRCSIELCAQWIQIDIWYSQPVLRKQQLWVAGEPPFASASRYNNKGTCLNVIAAEKDVFSNHNKWAIAIITVAKEDWRKYENRNHIATLSLRTHLCWQIRHYSHSISLTLAIYWQRRDYLIWFTLLLYCSGYRLTYRQDAHHITTMHALLCQSNYKYMTHTSLLPL